ncbi:MAG: hypothetical protein IJX28_01900 [Clostridia bacterium]|nr:hypothetical protein [Clostridia bacterium]
MKKRLLSLLLLTAMLLSVFAACTTTTPPTNDGTGTQGTAGTGDPTTEATTYDPNHSCTTAPPEPSVTPGEASVYSGTPDTSWYTGKATEYTLTSADQLVGFHSLRSDTCTFEGVTIKLDCDVILNEGTAEEIKARGSANHAWRQLNSAHLFKGTFDGQGHVISGLYMQLTASAVRGMFGGVGGNAVIKNFTLANSYFGGPSKDNKTTLGSIAAKISGEGANVTIENVISYAVLEEGEATFARVGGLVGMVTEGVTLTMKNCEFHGSVTISGNYAGGMIGMASHVEATVILNNCKNTGAITAASNAGGMMGICSVKSMDLTGCTNTGTIKADSGSGDLVGVQAVLADPNNGARPATPAGTTALRVMSFNIQTALTASNGVLTDAARNRIEAVRQEILFYDPDMFGLQEDSLVWHSNLNLTDYNRILDTTIGGTEMCAIYYKKGLPLLDSGSLWITNTGIGSGVGLTVADLTTPGSKYKLSDADLAELGITASSPNSVLTETRKYGDTSYTLLGNRKMTWGVFDINGQTVIYVNTHLQHRSQTSDYSTAAIQNIRSMERIKSFDLLQAQLKKLQEQFPNSVNYITGDFNDVVGTAIYNAATKDYGYASAHVSAAEKYGVDGSWNNAFDKAVMGDNYPSAAEGTGGSYLDYCFVSAGIDVLKFRVGAGKATITAVDGSTKTIYTSDHLPIITDLCFKTDKTGSPIDPDYKEEPDDITKPSVYSGVYDTSWYTGDKTEYVLTTADQLMGMVYLRSETCTFEGVTIKLGRDMIINEGTLEEIIARGSGNIAWRQLNSSYLFKGTFDGQGHSISGVYLALTTTGNRSMFGGVGGNAVIKNFTLENSYFTGPSVTGKNNLSCLVTKIAGSGANVTLSDLHIQSTLIAETTASMGNVAAFVGIHEAGTLTMTNCSFQGKIDYVDAADVGSFIGEMVTGTTLNLNNCTSSAELIAKRNCGGLIGFVASGATVNNNGSTFTGSITCAGSKSETIGNQAEA